MLVFFIIQSFLVGFIPIIGPIFAFFSQSFMYAFFCFTYKWGTEDIHIYRVIYFFDRRFFYFAGFGCIYAIITRIFPGLVGSGVYALIFPIFLLLSIKASPPKNTKVNDLAEFTQKFNVTAMLKSEREAMDNITDVEALSLLEKKLGIFRLSLEGIKFFGAYLNKRLSSHLKAN